MPYKNLRTMTKSAICICTLLCLLLSGCAQKRWAEALTEEENIAMGQLVTAMQEREHLCPQSYDADVKIFWQTPVADRAIEGYLQLSAPSSLKFIVSNPLGQPIFAFARDGKKFQLLEPLLQKHIRGSMRNLAIRNDIPLILAQGDWFAYLSGRLPVHPLQVLETTKATNDDTIWLKISGNSAGMAQGTIYLHLAPQNEELLGYLFLDDTGKTIAEINYLGEREGKNHCAVQTEIQISELPWGAEVQIQLEGILNLGQFNEQDFSLPVPKGFNTQIWP